MAASERPNRIFEVVKAVAETGVLTGKTRRVLDSTVLHDAVATQDTVIRLIAAIRRVHREVPGASEVVAQPLGLALAAPRAALRHRGHRGVRGPQHPRRPRVGVAPVSRGGEAVQQKPREG
jgi:hypothetical protein